MSKAKGFLLTAFIPATALSLMMSGCASTTQIVANGPKPLSPEEMQRQDAKVIGISLIQAGSNIKDPYAIMVGLSALRQSNPIINKSADDVAHAAQPATYVCQLTHATLKDGKKILSASKNDCKPTNP